MSHKAFLPCAGTLALAATLAGISPALSHVIVGPRFFPSTLTFERKPVSVSKRTSLRAADTEIGT